MSINRKMMQLIYVTFSGSNASGTSSTVTASSILRSTTTTNNRAHSTTRRAVSHHHQQQQRQQQQKQSRVPTLSGVIALPIRSLDDHGSRTGTTQDDNSNDSGLGSEERQQHLNNVNVST